MESQEQADITPDYKNQMPRENAPMIIKYFIEYAIDEHSITEKELQAVFDKTLQEVDAKAVFDEKENRIKTLSLDDLKNKGYYTSNDFSIKFYENLDSQLRGESNLGYHVGRIILDNEVPMFKRIASKFLGPEIIFDRFLEQLDDAVVDSEVKRWGNTKTISVKKVTGNRYDFIIKHYPGVKVSKIALELHRGIFESYFSLMGYKSKASYKKIHRTKEHYRFVVKYKTESWIRKLLARLPFLYHKKLKKQNIELLEVNFQLNRSIKKLEEELYQARLDYFNQNTELGKTKLKSSIKFDWLAKKIRALAHEVNNEVYYIKDYTSNNGNSSNPEDSFQIINNSLEHISQCNNEISKLFKQGLKRDSKTIQIKNMIEEIIKEYKFKYELRAKTIIIYLQKK